MKTKHFGSLLLLLILTACGGGGGDNGKPPFGGGSGTGIGPSTAPGVTPTPQPSAAATPAPTIEPIPDPIEVALKTASVQGLSSSDKATLLRLSQQTAGQYQQQQNTALADIYADNTLNLTLNHTTNSIEINRSISTMASPLIVADDGSGMAAISQYGKGRGLAYGVDMLKWMADKSKETQHLPLFTRAFNWVVTGKAAGPLPDTLRFATAGYDASTVSKFITLLGKKPEAISCDLTLSNNTCWQNADVLVFGAGVRDDANLTQLVRQYQASGKAIIYMHPNWIDSGGGRKVAKAMGMDLGGYPGNYFAGAAGVSVNSNRTIADALQRGDQMGALAKALEQMGTDNLSIDLAADTRATSAISQIHNEIATLQSSGIDLFAEAPTDLHRLLILWADLYRPTIQYGKINRTTNPGEFLRTFASDSWLAYNRSYTTFASAGQGDFMPVAAQSIPVSQNDELIDVTIAQTGGTTAIGRASIPGKPVWIEIVDNGSANLSIQTNHVRAYGNPLTDNVAEGYKRPRRPQSFAIPLNTSKATVFVSPFGGPLYLNYSGASAGQTVTLKIRGAAKYAHFDFTKPQSDAEIDEAVAALKRKDFGWQTAKFVGGEIQQTIYYANQAMGNIDPKVYILEQIKGSLFDSNHLANGYSNMPMSANVSQLCTQWGWQCDGPIHRAPGVQHFVGWIAACGFLCSGNPSDGFAGISGTGWGHAHELGHNTVQRVMSIDFNGQGCVVECNNNILASAQMMRQFKTLGVDTGHTTNHPLLYQYIIANRATGLSGDAKILDMQKRLWTMAAQDPMRAVHFQLAFLFSKYRVNEAKPSMEASLDYFTLLTKGDRLVSRAWDANNKGKYAMGSYADNKTINNPDLLYVLSSKIIGKDLKNIFAMYGITLTPTAISSVAALGLDVLPETFYALATTKYNQVSTGVWLDLSAQAPAYPF
ncbi:ImpA family metalloprotease [uncultured Deefgea sp.]|uniref:ImpA family metalloprotease n=1 Tax=uncultured Deefgea sp. TaxID=1304914 RepID=UPI0025974BE3|nr:ImpA family metalloprotease [uncultured Deefgea sp.]